MNSEAYQGHPIFQDLDSFVEFYEDLGYQTWTYLSEGTRAVFGLDSFVFSSIQGTLDSVRMLLRAGMMNDAYALVRAYHDAAIINAYTAHYLKSHFGIDQFIVESIEGWRSGKLKLPRFKTMLTYLRGADSLVTLGKVFGADQRYDDRRRPATLEALQQRIGFVQTPEAFAAEGGVARTLGEPIRVPGANECMTRPLDILHQGPGFETEDAESSPGPLR